MLLKYFQVLYFELIKQLIQYHSCHKLLNADKIYHKLKKFEAIEIVFVHL